MKKSVQISFIVVVFLILFLPILKFNLKGTISEREKRTLEKKPEFALTNFSQYDAYFQDRFGGRDAFVDIANFIDYKVFNSNGRVGLGSSNNETVKGKNGWIFTISAGNLNDYLKTNLLTESELIKAKNAIQSKIDWCNENDIKSLFVIGPNKHAIYPENYLFERPEGKTRIDQIVEIFEELDANYVYPRDYLLEKKKTQELPLYYETDTHWNLLGGYYAYEKINEIVLKLFPNVEFPQIEYEITDVHTRYDYGDLLPVMGLKEGESTHVILEPKGASFSDYYPYMRNENLGIDGVFTKSNDKSLPKVIIYRDSFYASLTPYFSTLFSEAEYIWKPFKEEDKQYVLNEKPDLLVFEAVECFIDNIIYSE